MNYKTSKILSIIAGGTVLIAFFMPWMQSSFGARTSAWDLTKVLFQVLTKAHNLPEDIRIYLPFILIALPICSLRIIINNIQSINVNKGSAKAPKVIIIIVASSTLIALIYAQSENEFSDLINIFDLLGAGFYLTLIASFYFIIDLALVRKKDQTVSNSKEETKELADEKYGENKL